VLALVPLAGAFLEPAPALVVPGAGPVTMATEPAGPARDPLQQEDPTDQEEREQEEPGEERTAPVVDDVDDLDLLAVRLGDLDLLDALRDPAALTRSVGADPDSDSREEHQQRCNYDPSTHLRTSLSRVSLEIGAEM
jgi:hypothetical protein